MSICKRSLILPASRLVIAFLAVLLPTLIVSLPSQALADKSVVVTFNGKRVSFDVEPVIQKGRILVPLRTIAHIYGAELDWINSTVVIRKGNDRIELVTNTAKAYKNGLPMNLEVHTRVIQGRTLVPLRFLSEALGLGVEWQGSTRTVMIQTPGLSAKPDYHSKALYELENRSDRLEAIVQRIKARGSSLTDRDFVEIKSYRIDLNQDGNGESVSVMGIPLLENSSEWFWDPLYLVYPNALNGQVQISELTGNALELHTRYLRFVSGDLDGDGLPEIWYSIDVPLPEYSPCYPHYLKLDRQTGIFRDTNIAEEYGYLIADWGLKNCSENDHVMLWLDLRQCVTDNQPKKQWFHLTGEGLESVEDCQS